MALSWRRQKMNSPFNDWRRSSLKARGNAASRSDHVRRERRTSDAIFPNDMISEISVTLTYQEVENDGITVEKGVTSW